MCMHTGGLLRIFVKRSRLAGGEQCVALCALFDAAKDRLSSVLLELAGALELVAAVLFAETHRLREGSQRAPSSDNHVRGFIAVGVNARHGEDVVDLFNGFEECGAQW
ncbi:hypothetical protein CSING_01045 [Corynebacterium singulare]|uniref:Uncharacterized protein n=1 Tax=Corynebacterium singulare TaxID=161899 RepID=A0A0B6EML9_9CORY|nr:hypothetical protein CSING_01045 [Corynebacterium singulare]